MSRRRLAPHDEFESGERRPGREQREPEGAAVHRRVAAAGVPHPPRGLGLHPLDVLARVHPQELLDGRLARGDHMELVVEAGGPDHVAGSHDPGRVVDVEVVLEKTLDREVHRPPSHVVGREALVPAQSSRHRHLPR